MLGMYERLLLALDGSDYAEWARSVALQLVRPGGTVHLLHVVDIVTLEGTFLRDLAGAIGVEPYLNLSPKMEKILQEKGKALLEAHREVVTAAGFDCETELVTGIIASEILKRAESADAVVVGQRGSNARFHAGLAGSVSEVLVRRATCPVVVVPQKPGPIGDILLAYDGSPPSTRALEHAARLAAGLKVPVAVVAVTDDGAEGDNMLAPARRLLSEAGVTSTFATRPGKAGEAIVAEAAGHGLLVAGAHGHSRIVELVVGSTTEYLLRNTPIPVLFER